MLFVLAVGLSIWGIMTSLMVWLSNAEGHAFWWPRYCVYIFNKLPQVLQEKFKKPMALAGYSDQQLALWFGKSVLMTALACLGLVLINNGLMSLLSAGLVCWSWRPFINAGRSARARQREAVFALPVIMDSLAMLMATGVPLISALQRGLSRSRTNALQQELRVVLHDVRMGISLAKALEQFCQRLPRPEIRLFANLLLQSSQQGNSLVPLLEQQAKTRR